MTVDKNGKEIKVGSLISVQARVQHIEGEGEAALFAALTETEHGPDNKKYSLPVLHGSQVEVIGE